MVNWDKLDSRSEHSQVKPDAKKKEIDTDGNDKLYKQLYERKLEDYFPLNLGILFLALMFLA